MESIPPEALLAAYSPRHQAIANKLRRLVKAAVPSAVERVRAGWNLIGYDVPVGRRTRYFAWIWLQPEHVHLGFQNGVLMDDPDHLLQGAGITKNVRWVTLNSAADIRAAELQALVREAARVAAMSRAERTLRQIDLDERA